MGRRKFTDDEVRVKYLEAGILLDEPFCYNGAHVKNKGTCSSGHKMEISLTNLQQGIGCAECSGKKKYTTEQARAIHVEYGHPVIEPFRYINNKTKNKCTCPNGHEIEISLASLRKGQGCKQCADDNKRFTDDEVRAIHAQYGYPVIEPFQHTNVMTKNKCTCPNGHEIEISLNNLLRGHGCGKCKNKSETKALDHVTINREATSQFKSDFCPGKRFDIVIEDRRRPAFQASQ